VRDQIANVIVRHEKVSRPAAHDRAAELLETGGSERSRLDLFPHELSGGGMRQRVVIASVWALQPPLMIMGEPTTVLDVVVWSAGTTTWYERK
jgi:ABC-type glutathione transport system ATPase component